MTSIDTFNHMKSEQGLLDLSTLSPTNHSNSSFFNPDRHFLRLEAHGGEGLKLFQRLYSTAFVILEITRKFKLKKLSNHLHHLPTTSFAPALAFLIKIRISESYSKTMGGFFLLTVVKFMKILF